VTRTKEILELIHSDVFGHVSVPSLGGSMYYVSFIDDFSRNTWIYLLRKKSKVFDKFKEFKSLVEIKTYKKIRVLRIDNGGEFFGNDFEQFCKQCDIACQNTTLYTPQKNGVIERMNKTLMDKERSMLNGVKLAQELWEDVVDTKKYLVNRSPSSVLVDSTPHEVRFGKNPSLSHLKVFVYDAFVHVPKEKRNTLDNKLVKFIFIGYNDVMKGYKL
jgi:transposase InsO family protein